MNTLPSRLFAAATLAGSLASASMALAHEAAVHARPGSSLGISSRGALSSRVPIASPGAAPSSATLALLPPAPPSDDTPPAADVQRLLTERPVPVTCTNPCGGPKKLPGAPAELLRELGEVPVLGTVMVPVTRGVTIETGAGKPTLTLAVKPTKITRGSGLVAIGRF